jgi:hypothetical protein
MGGFRVHLEPFLKRVGEIGAWIDGRLVVRWCYASVFFWISHLYPATAA